MTMFKLNQLNCMEVVRVCPEEYLKLIISRMGQDVQLVLAYIAAIVINWSNFENV